MSVITLNMAKETDIDKIISELRAFRDVDMLLLQEVKQDQGQRQCSAEQIAALLGLHVAYSPAESGVTDQGLAILSRFPLHDVRVSALKRFDLRYHSRSRFVLAATADSPWGPVRVFNTHLDTRLNTRERLQQLEPVLRDSAEFDGPRIIGGDFNSNSFYWIGHILPLPAFRSQAYGVQDFMVRNGFRTAGSVSEPTFDYLGMRLDWIWLRGLEASESRIYPLHFSDHHALWTRIIPTVPPPVLSTMGLRPTYRDENPQPQAWRTHSCVPRRDFSRRLLADATVQAQAPRRVSELLKSPGHFSIGMEIA
jgi:endonuclease/exonuclease/phosphatase family metal-dependent hydrolase